MGNARVRPCIPTCLQGVHLATIGFMFRVWGAVLCDLVPEWVHFTILWDTTIPYRTESVHFLGLMNSATKLSAYAIRADVRLLATSGCEGFKYGLRV